ncbi:MAG TPA: FecR domain-containing protein [Bacteroidales bacterium]|nr:FecR domain-containing protein [Bacteroidales bacterium]
MKPEDDLLKQFGLEDDEALREALSCISEVKVNPGLSKEAAWERFEQAIKEDSRQLPKARSSSFSVIWKVAASFVVILSLWLGFNAWNKVSYITANSQVKEIELPDNSIVTLNAASSLRFNRMGWKSSRRVSLNGEALFRVRKGSSFEVSALGNTVRVLGTEFNVFSREYFEVKCISGSVQVQIPGAQKIILDKGKAVKKTTNELPHQFDITTNAAGWVNGDFYYNRTDLKTVFDEIARQFNVHIVTNTAMDRQYSGYFNKTDLEQALRNICLPMGLQYKISNDSVIITKGI